MLNKSQSVVAFIDILGFKEIVKTNDKSKNNFIFIQLQQALDQSFKKAILLTEQWLKATDEYKNEGLADRLKYKQFSDNVYLSFEYNEGDPDYELAVYLVTMMSAYYQRIMLSKNFYVRGGIADGQNYFDNNMIFSKALIKAYELETKIAKYPRIVLDNSILKKLNKISKQNIIKQFYPKLIVKDWTGVPFLNPFKLVDSITTMFTSYPEILPKLQEVLVKNPVLTESNQNLEPDILDEDLTNMVLENILIKLKKYRRIPDLYEKYLWLREFVDWQDEYKSNLDFRYY